MASGSPTPPKGKSEKQNAVDSKQFKESLSEDRGNRRPPGWQEQ